MMRSVRAKNFFPVMILLLTLSVILLISIYLGTDVRWKELSPGFDITNVSWKNATAEGKNQDPLHYSAKNLPGRKYFHINFSFKADSNEGYPNILQTSSANNGIRLELSKPSTLALIIGGNKDSFVVTHALTLGEWHEAIIDITPENHIRVVFDKHLMLDQSRNLDYRIDDVLIGSGFSGTRPFYGDIRVHSLSYGFVEKNWLVIRGFSLWVLFATVAILIMIAGPIFRLSKMLILKALIQWAHLNSRNPLLSQNKIKITHSIRINDKADLVKLILVVGTLSAIIFHYSKFAFVGDHAPKPDSFLHFPMNIFCDFYSLFDGYARLKYSVAMNYFPALFIPLGLLAKMTNSNPYIAIQVLLIFYMAFLVPYVYLSIRSIQPAPKMLTAFSLIACNYPVLFTLHSGNFEMLCFLLVAYGIFFHIKRLNIPAGALIGIAAAIKLYPAIFLFAMATKGNWRKLFIGSAFGFLSSIAIGFDISGSIYSNILDWANVVQKGFENYTGMMVLSYNGVFFGHSLMNAFRVIVGPGYNVSGLMPYYMVFCGIAILATLAITIKTRYLYMRILLLACAICVFAPTSQDYKLLYLTIPMLLLLRSYREYGQETLLGVLVLLLFIPKTYFHFYNSVFINSNTVLNAIILLSLILYCAYLSLFDKRFMRRNVMRNLISNRPYRA